MQRQQVAHHAVRGGASMPSMGGLIKQEGAATAQVGASAAVAYGGHHEVLAWTEGRKREKAQK